MQVISSDKVYTETPKLAKKRILVLISEGGGGHKMAGESLKDILSSEYNVEVVNVFTQIIYPLDWLNAITSGIFTAEDFYNFMLRKGYHKGVHVYATVGNKYMSANRLRIEKLFEKYLVKAWASYDLVISTVPFINSGIAKALQKRKIPFLILPTDLDTSTFFAGMTQKQFHDDDRIAFSLPYDDVDLRKKGLKNSPIPQDKIVISGFPVRGACQKQYSPEAIHLLKCKHGMRDRHLSITLILGTTGNRMLLEYTQELAKLSNADFSLPLQLNICVGRNEKIRKTILQWLLDQGGSIVCENTVFTTVKAKNGLLFHLRKFTKDLIEIMVASNLIITKTGSCSVNEGIYLGRKLLLDNTDTSSARYLFWETFNLYFVRKHGLGDVFYQLSEMTTLVRVLLHEDLGHPVVSGAFPLPDFRENIQKIVTNLVNPLP
jgi:UDP-N-acetylglucosamine:LPS N-acetylglucosamine transferase